MSEYGLYTGFLGHESTETTQHYARANAKQKQEALEKAYVNVNPGEVPLWSKVMKLSWLKSF